MRIKQLGNGGAFDTESTNSSFLIDFNGLDKNYLLFDCGYNVFTKLKELEKEYPDIIKKISNIYVSHLDDDHVGSLKSLIYYRYYIHGLTTRVYSAVKEVETFLEDVNYKMSFNRLIENKICVYCYLKDNINGYTDHILTPVKTFHHLECYGLKIVNDDNCIYISGDTKVCEDTIITLKHIENTYGKYKIFHDFSNYNNYENNVHTCEYDFNKYYKDLKCFDKIIKYHNNEIFNEEWTTT